jgi:hypothetical protein
MITRSQLFFNQNSSDDRMHKCINVISQFDYKFSLFKHDINSTDL